MSSVILNDGFKVKGSFGKEINSPLFIQFVEGQCIDNCVAPDSLRSAGNLKNINTIIAKPHIYNEAPPTPFSRLGDEYRYKPLLRGITEVPAKGDPVLLCTIGGINYYLGPLNTQNSVNHNTDNKSTPQINFNFTKQSQGSTAQGVSHESINFEKQPYNRMQKLFNDELDHPDGGWQANSRSPIENHGDMLVEGRHGNSIRVGSRYRNPYMFFSNGRNPSNEVESLNDGSLISITSHGTLAQHFGGFIDDIHSEPENIITYDNFILSSDTIPENENTIGKMLDSINKPGPNSPNIINDYGNEINQSQILFHSDRIIINSKRDDIYLSSLKDIHIGTGRTMSISTSQDLIIQSERTFLGNPEPNQSTVDMEPMILGNQLLEIMREFMSELQKAHALCNGVPLPLVDATSAPLSTKIKPIEQKLTNIISQHHFIEPNR